MNNNNNIKIRMISWNMGENKKTLKEWINELNQWEIINNIKNKYDIIIVGLQENWNGQYGKFNKALHTILNEYVHLENKTRGPPDIINKPFAVQLNVYIKPKLLPQSFTYYQKKSICIKPTFFFFCRKATVGISIIINNDTQLILMTSHLPFNYRLDDFGYNERTDAIDKSIQNVLNPLLYTQKDNLMIKNRIILWSGDLNFRRIDINDSSNYELKDKMIQTREHDQLTYLLKTNSLLNNFNETLVNFPPSCKVSPCSNDQCSLCRLQNTGQIGSKLVNKDCYLTNTKKGKRIPSHCDRILWKSMPPNVLQSTGLYTTWANSISVRESDHNLIYEDFILSLF